MQQHFKTARRALNRANQQGKRPTPWASSHLRVYLLGLLFGLSVLGTIAPWPLVQTQAQAQESDPTTTLPDLVGASILRNLSRQTQRPPYSFRITSSQSMTWPDSCLGLGSPGLLCTQMTVPGWRVVATDDQERWIYRTNGTGSIVQLETRVPFQEMTMPVPPATRQQPAFSSTRRPPLGLNRTSPTGAAIGATVGTTTGGSIAGNVVAGPASNPLPSTTEPLPQERQPASAKLPANTRQATVRLINRTGAAIGYQVIGDTTQRLLPGKATTTLQSLDIPIGVTFRRQDFGLLEVTTQTTTTPGELLVYLDATTDLGLDRTTLSIETSGEVFLN